MSLSLLPANALVGLITYGTMVGLAYLGYPYCENSMLIQG